MLAHVTGALSDLTVSNSSAFDHAVGAAKPWRALSPSLQAAGDPDEVSLELSLNISSQPNCELFPKTQSGRRDLLVTGR